jgi:uncharacterized protein (UPF0332 family)
VSPENIRANIADELEVAASTLNAAEALLGMGLVRDAASRAYYAAFHAARALLLSVGVEPRSHRALRSLVSRHFVRSGKLAAHWSKDLGLLESLREAGDYDSAFALSVDDLRPEVGKARAFVSEVRRILAVEGLIE